MPFDKDFRAAFGVKPPPLLSRLATWSSAEQAYAGADVELRVHGPDHLAELWDLDEGAAKKVLVFGHDPMDSDYGIWLTEGAALESAPIVYLNGEGCDNTVVAGNLGEFLGLLASGFECIGLLSELRGAKWKKKKAKAVDAYAAWLVKNGVRPLEGAAVWPAIQAAVKAHPSFDEWLEKHRG